jgi:SNF2 family DNA or RNA helicase
MVYKTNQVVKDLPQKREYVLYAPLVPQQKELYEAALTGQLGLVIAKLLAPDATEVDKENPTSRRFRTEVVKYGDISDEEYFDSVNTPIIKTVAKPSNELTTEYISILI